MIFVTVGTNEARFDRLLRAISALQIDERLVVQHGHSSPIPAAHAEMVEFLEFDRMVETIRAARLVVAHAGVGSVMVALANAKRPIVVPRRKAFGEAVDDHQLQLGRRFAAAGLVTLVETPDDLGEALGSPEEATLVPTAGALAADLRIYLESALAARPAAAPA